MNIFDLFVPIDTARAATTLAVNFLFQSSLIVAAGLLAARRLRTHGAAVQSTVLRVTLIAVLACPIASWMLAAAGVPGFGIELPKAKTLVLAIQAEAVPSSKSQEMTNASDEFEPSVAEVARLREPAQTRLNSSESSYQENSPQQDAGSDDLRPAPPAMDLTVAQASSQQHQTARRSLTVPPMSFVYAAAGLTWSLVTVILIARIVLANLLVFRGRVRATAADTSTVSTCESLARVIGVAPPEIRVSSHIQSPCLVGVVRPAILLPKTMRPVSRDVLVHELAHLRRRDCVWQLLCCLTTAAFWFQPLVWLLSRRIEQTADDVADDFVVQFGNDRAEYARQLLDIAERYQPEWSAACVGAGIVSFKSSLGKRVVRILDTTRSPSTRTGLVALCAIVLLGAACTLTVGLLGTGSVRAQAAADESDATVLPPLSPAKPRERAQEVEAITYRGRVLDPDGKPFAGAKLYLTVPLKDDLREQSHATSDIDGRFKVTIAKSDFSTKHRERPWEWVGSIIAVADGFGLASAGTYNRNLDEPFELHLAKADLPVSGRILDLQGQPISGVRVRFNSLHIPIPGNGGVDAWQAATQDRRDGMDLQRKFFSMVHLPSFLRGEETKTGDDGKYSLPGFGRDRIVSLIIEAPTIQTQEISIVTRENLPPISLPWYAHAPQLGTLLHYAPGSDHVAGPTRRVIGMVKDQSTGEPLAGFEVAGDRVGNPMRAVKATTDEKGRFELTGLPLQSQQRLSVSPPDDQPYITISRSIHLQVSDKPLLVDFEVPRGVWAEGKVVDKKTRKPAKARASYYPMLENESLATLGDARLPIQMMNIYTNEDGTFRTPVLPGRGIFAVRGQSTQRVASRCEVPRFNIFQTA